MTDLASLRSDALARQQDKAQLRRRAEATQQRFDQLFAARDAKRADEKRADKAAARDDANAKEPETAKDPAGKSATPADPAPVQTKPRPAWPDASKPEATSTARRDDAPAAPDRASKARDADSDREAATDRTDDTNRPADDTVAAGPGRSATDAPADAPQPAQTPDGSADGQGGRRQGQRQAPEPGAEAVTVAAATDPDASAALTAATATAPVVGLLALQAAPPGAIRLPDPGTTGRIDGAAPSRIGAPRFGFANAGIEKAGLEIAKPAGAALTAGREFSAALSASREPDAAAGEAQAAPASDPQAIVADLAASAKLTHAGDATRHPVSTSATPSPAVPPEGIAITIATKLSEGIRRFEIRLDPADLGRVDVSLEVARDGQVRATLAVERMETLDLLRRDAPRLEQALRELGVTTGDRDVQLTLRDQGSPGDGRGEDARQRFAATERATLVVPDTATDEAALSAAIYNRLTARPGGVDISI